MCQGLASPESDEDAAGGCFAGAVAFWLQPNVKARIAAKIAQASRH
jgi:hypothetical protein